jgi:hypothetical protein
VRLPPPNNRSPRFAEDLDGEEQCVITPTLLLIIGVKLVGDAVAGFSA